MRTFRHQLLTQLLARPEALSRNRHFDTFDDAAGRAALRTVRHLRGLERDITALAAGTAIGVTHLSRDGEPWVRLDWAGARGKRTSYLSPSEYRMLLGRPGVREVLER